MVILQDVTERRHAEEVVRESAERFRALFDEAPFAIALVSPAEGIVETNQGLQRMLGYSHDEMKGTLHREFLSPGFERGGQGNMERALVGELEHDEREWMYRRKDGVDVWARGRTSVLRDAAGAVTYVQLMLQDITERRRAEEELRASERRFRSLFDAAPTGIALTDTDSKVTAVNPQLVRFLGYSARELIGSELRSYVSPEVEMPDRSRSEDVYSGRSDNYAADVLMRRRDGQDVWAHGSISPVHGEDGAVEFGMITLEDIDSRQRAELELVESEERFRHLFDAAPLGIVLKDPANRMIMVNHAMGALLGCSAAELGGRNLFEFTSARTIVRNQRRHQALVAGEIDESRRERWLVRSDGSEVFVSSIESAVRDASGGLRYSVMTMEDITERTRALG
jgi:two-component system cell cycle sensor histidine kinase/response regulator CckA